MRLPRPDLDETSMAPLLACGGLEVEIGGKCVCHGLSWSVAAGEIWFVLGENGVGKSTLLSTLAGIRAARSGEVRLAGMALAQWSERARARRRALLCQHDDDPFPATVLERVLVGRHPYLPRFGWETAGDEAIARAALAAVGLAGLEGRAVGTLSGGERRRVSLAAVLAQQATVMLLDEPTSQLDLRHQVAVLALLREQALGERRALVLVSHDPNLALRFGTHALLLFGGGQVAAGPVDQVLSAEALSRLYRHPLHAIVADGQRYFLPACDVPPSRAVRIVAPAPPSRGAVRAAAQRAEPRAHDRWR